MYKRLINKLPAVLLCALLTLASTTAYASAAEPPPIPEDDPGISADSVTVYQMEDAPLPGIFPGGNTSDATSPILKDVRAVEQGGQTLLIKTWDAPPGYAPELLAEEDFEKGGLRYAQAYVLLVSENYSSQNKLASETVTVVHEGKDDALSRLQPILEYEQDGYSGQLTLNADAISTEPTGQNSYSYAVTDVREYPGLERNDPYHVPKTVGKNGVTLQLADLQWRLMGGGGYMATASYSGSATGTAVSGYLSTATYMGEVTKSVLDSVTYAVVYEGSPIPLPPFDYAPYLLTGGGALAVLLAAAFLLHKRDNTKIYAMIGNEYQLVHKQKLTSLSPIVDLSPEEISGESEEFMIVLDRLALRKLRGHSIKIIGKDGTMKEQRIYKVRHFHINHGLQEDSECNGN